MAPLPKKSPDLGNSFPVPRALMYVASLRTFGPSSSSSRRGWSGTDERKLKRLKRLIRMNLENTDLIYRLLLSAIWVVFVFCLSSMHSCAPSAYTLAYPTVLTIVHLDSTSILSLYTSSMNRVIVLLHIDRRVPCAIFALHFAPKRHIMWLKDSVNILLASHL
jgi:hypothetical protein